MKNDLVLDHARAPGLVIVLLVLKMSVNLDRAQDPDQYQAQGLTIMIQRITITTTTTTVTSKPEVIMHRGRGQDHDLFLTHRPDLDHGHQIPTKEQDNLTRPILSKKILAARAENLHVNIQQRNSSTFIMNYYEREFQ